MVKINDYLPVRSYILEIWNHSTQMLLITKYVVD
jgi:hypothetical protein